MTMININCKRLQVRLDMDDMNQRTYLSVSNFVAQRNVEQYGIFNNGVIIFISDGKKIRLHSGMKTLQKEWDLKTTPERIQSDKIPDTFLREYFVNGFSSDRIIECNGYLFSSAYIESKIQSERNRVINETLISNPVLQMVKDGLIPLSQINSIVQAKTTFEKLKTQENRMRPDLKEDEEYEMKFEEYKIVDGKNTPTGNYVPTTVYIRKINEGVKQKHWYIYSEKPGFGKSYHMEQLQTLYNAHIIGDPRNWHDVPECTQFVIFDEFSKETLKALGGFSKLKALTSGNGLVAFNKKTFGDSFLPRKDIQVICTSNYPPYDIIGQWDNKLQRNIIDESTLMQFKDRFITVCLDGDDKKHMRAALQPKDWSEEDIRHFILSSLQKFREEGFYLGPAIKTSENIIETYSRCVESRSIKRQCLSSFLDLFRSFRQCSNETRDEIQEKFILIFKTLYDEDLSVKVPQSHSKSFRSVKTRLEHLLSDYDNGLIPEHAHIIESVRAMKKIEYEDLDEMIDIVQKYRDDREKMKKEVWKSLGACFVEDEYYSAMSIDELCESVNSHPLLVKRLPITTYGNIGLDFEKCIRLHTMNREPTELEILKYRSLVYDPMMTWRKRPHLPWNELIDEK